LTVLERKAAAADTSRQAGPETLEFGDPLIDTLCPTSGDFGPIRAFRRPVLWQLGEFGANLFERQTDALRENNEGDPAEDRPEVTAMPGASTLGLNKSSLLVKPERRCRYATSTRYL